MSQRPQIESSSQSVRLPPAGRQVLKSGKVLLKVLALAGVGDFDQSFAVSGWLDRAIDQGRSAVGLLYVSKRNMRSL